MDKRIVPVESLILSGLAERFKQVFDIKLHFSSSEDKKATVAKMVGGSKADIFAFATMSSLALDTERYSAPALLRRGIASQSSHDSVLAHRLAMVPTITTFQIDLVAPDMQSVMPFAKTWIFASVAGYLNFSLTYGVVDLDIRLDLDKELTIPTRPNGVTDVNQIEFQSSLRVWGYHSENKLKQSQAVTSIEVEGVLTSKEEYEALTQPGKSNVQVHLFKRKWNTVEGPLGSSGDPKDTGA